MVGCEECEDGVMKYGNALLVECPMCYPHRVPVNNVGIQLLLW